MKQFLALFGSLAGLTLVASPSAAAEEPAPGKQVECSYETPDGLTVPYLLYLPKAMEEESGEKRSVILFLHGRGESYGPLSIVAKWGPPRMAARGDDPPYVVLSPQCPGESSWTTDEQQKGVLALLDHIVATYPVDESRIYLTGLSMGGYGSWKLAADQPKRFAAVAPVCGKGDPENASKLVDVPIWAWHGTEDRAVPYRHSAEMVEAIEKAGGEKMRLTTLKHIGHNSWSAAYATPELYQWFDQHRLAR